MSYVHDRTLVVACCFAGGWARTSGTVEIDSWAAMKTSENGSRIQSNGVATIAIVEDDKPLLDMLVQYLRSQNYRTRGFGRAEDLLELIDWTSGINCIVSDVRMPGIGGLGLIERLRQMGHRVPVILITGHGDIPMAVQAIKNGAFDFIEKPLDPVHFERVIANALNSGSQDQDVAAEVREARRILSGLTPQQSRILGYVADGLSSKEIALHINISPRTVEVHRAAIMQRLQVNSLADLIKLKMLVDWPQVAVGSARNDA